MPNDPQPLRFPPLDQGDHVGIASTDKDYDAGALDLAAQYVNAFGEEPDLVLVAVPKGKGIILETWLEHALGVASGREEQP